MTIEEQVKELESAVKELAEFAILQSKLISALVVQALVVQEHIKETRKGGINGSTLPKVPGASV